MSSSTTGTRLVGCHASSLSISLISSVLICTCTPTAGACTCLRVGGSTLRWRCGEGEGRGGEGGGHTESCRVGEGGQRSRGGQFKQTLADACSNMMSANECIHTKGSHDATPHQCTHSATSICRCNQCRIHQRNPHQCCTMPEVELREL